MGKEKQTHLALLSSNLSIVWFLVSRYFAWVCLGSCAASPLLLKLGCFKTATLAFPLSLTGSYASKKKKKKSHSHQRMCITQPELCVVIAAVCGLEKEADAVSDAQKEF